MLDSGVTDFISFEDKKTRNITLFDGSTFQLECVEGRVEVDRRVGVDPLTLNRYTWGVVDNFNVIVSNPDGGNVKYLAECRR